MDIKDVEQIVYRERPGLLEVLKQEGNLSLIDYVKNQAYQIKPNHLGRSSEIISVISDEVKRTFSVLGNDIAQKMSDEIAQEFSLNFYTSTSEHHHPFSNLFFSDGLLVQSIAQKQKGFAYMVVLGCAGVSISNSSFPRGLMVHDRNLNITNIHLLSRKDFHLPVWCQKPYTSKSELQVREDIEQGSFFDTDRIKLHSLFSEVYFNSDVYRFNSYIDQASYTNYLLWQKMPQYNGVDLISLSQETIATKLLCEYHLGKKTFIDTLICTASGAQLFEKYFVNIPGAFSNEELKGTFMFWGIQDNKRVRLLQKKNIEKNIVDLYTDDGTFFISLTAESVSKALLEKRIMPSISIIHIIISLYYGLVSGGGFSQVHYLSEMKKQYMLLASELGFSEESLYVKDIQTNVLSSDFVCTFISHKEKSSNATLLDCIVYGDQSFAQKLIEVISCVTLIQASQLLLKEHYRILTGKQIEKDMFENLVRPKPILEI